MEGRREGSSWRCLCPVHNGRALIVTRAKSGKLLVNCKTGCSQDAVIDALRSKGLWTSVPRNGKRPEALEARYEVRDTGGTIVAVHVRRDDKGGKRFHWLRDGKMSLGGLSVRALPLYGAETLAKLPAGSRVVVCEGEQAADALRARGIAALGTVTGAATTPAPESLRPLLPFETILWPDNDDAGRVHMQRIAEALHGLSHTDIRWVEWTGAPSAGDAADFTGDNNELAGLLDSSTRLEPRQEPGAPSMGPAVLVRMADVQPEDVEWLWSDRIPVGRLTMLIGDPGVGKSFVTLAVATAATLGLALPGDSASREPTGVLLLTAEDGLADTVRPRLDAMGADLERVEALTAVRDLQGTERWPSLAEHLNVLDGVLSRGCFGLVIIDPLNAFLGGSVDAFRDNEVRGLLGPLAQLAERHSVAVLCVSHLTKGRRDHALYRAQGSIAFGAAARCVMLAGQDPDSGERGLVVVKNNLAPIAVAGYEIGEGGFGWTGESSLTTGHLLAADTEPGASEALGEAEGFLRELLDNGPVSAKGVQAEARASGISVATLRRAKKKLGVKVQRLGMSGKRGGGEWEWALGDLDAHCDSLSILTSSVSETGSDGVADEHLNPACSLCGSAAVVGYTGAGEPRCFAHYVRPMDAMLVRNAVEVQGLNISARQSPNGNA